MRFPDVLLLSKGHNGLVSSKPEVKTMNGAINRAKKPVQISREREEVQEDSMKSIENSTRKGSMKLLGALVLAGFAAMAWAFAPAFPAAAPLLADEYRSGLTTEMSLGEEWFHPITGQMSAAMSLGKAVDTVVGSSNQQFLGEEWFHPVTGQMTAPLSLGIAVDGVVGSSSQQFLGEEWFHPVTGQTTVALS